MERLIVYGSPGTGKTFTLLKYLEKELNRGIPIEQVAFLTFTRRARREAVQRVEQVLGITVNDLPFFRTIHSMAYRALALREGDVVTTQNLTEFGAALGLKFGQQAVSELAAEGLGSGDLGDQLMALDNLARLRGETLENTWRAAHSQIDWLVVDQFSRSYREYKKEQVLLDFSDVLLEFVKKECRLPIEVAFIDEAQDLSSLQWYAALQACERATRQYVAGDDDQCIYQWAGADVESFLHLPGERQILPQSHRLPRRIHNLASRLVAQIKQRVDKPFNPRDDEGCIVQHADASSIPVKNDQHWLWLVRNRYLMPGLENELERRGLVYTHHGLCSVREEEREAIYTWERLRAGKACEAKAIRMVYKRLRSRVQVAHGFKLLPGVFEDQRLTLEELVATHGLLTNLPWYEVFLSIPIERRMYYRNLLRAHGTLKLSPQVQLETIHGAKGAEATHVALFLEQSRRVWEEAALAPDEEHRVWYVGVTRASQELHVIEPSNRWGYELPRGH